MVVNRSIIDQAKNLVNIKTILGPQQFIMLSTLITVFSIEIVFFRTSYHHQMFTVQTNVHREAKCSPGGQMFNVRTNVHREGTCSP